MFRPNRAGDTTTATGAPGKPCATRLWTTRGLAVPPRRGQHAMERRGLPARRQRPASHVNPGQDRPRTDRRRPRRARRCPGDSVSAPHRAHPARKKKIDDRSWMRLEEPMPGAWGGGESGHLLPAVSRGSGACSDEAKSRVTTSRFMTTLIGIWVTRLHPNVRHSYSPMSSDDLCNGSSIWALIFSVTVVGAPKYSDTLWWFSDAK
jgi:hypothetical protein